MLTLIEETLLVLLAASVKAILLALVAGAFLYGLRIQNRNAHHRVWCAVLAAMLCLPLLQLLTPSTPLPESLADYLRLAANRSPRRGPALVAGALDPTARKGLRDDLPVQIDRPFVDGNGSALAGVANMTIERRQGQIDNWFDKTANRDSSQSMHPREAAQVAPYASWQTGAFSVYAIGVLYFVVRFGLGIWGSRRLNLHSRPVSFDEPGLYPAFECDAIRVPLTAGFFRPRILLPTDWSTWSKELLSCVLRHEKAHIDRRDNLVAVAAEINRCLYWFHPLAWFLRRRLAQLAEATCDDIVIDAIGDRHCYAKHLLDIARRVSRMNPRVAAFGISMARTSQVETRIESILDVTRPMARRIGWRGTVSMAAIAIPLIVVVAGLRAGEEPSHSSDGSTEKLPTTAPRPNSPNVTPGTTATAAGNKRERADTQVTAAQPKTRMDLYGDPLPAGAVARLGTVRYRYPGWHPKPVAFLPDGETFVVAKGDDTVRAWDARSGKLVHEIDLGADLMQAYCLSRDAKRLATFSYQLNLAVREYTMRLSVWDTQSWAEMLRRVWKEPHGFGAPQQIAFAPTENIIALGVSDGTVRLVDFVAGAELSRNKILRGDIRSLDFSPTGNIIAVAGENGVALWEYLTEDEPASLAGLPRGGHTVRFSPDGALLIVDADDDQAATIFDVQTRKLLRQLRGRNGDGGAGMASFSADGEQLLAPGSKGNSVEFFDVQTGQVLRSFNTGPRTPRRLAISGDGRLLAGVDGEAAIHVWDMQTGEQISERFVGHLDTPYEIRFTPDGQQIVTGSIDGTIRLWNAVTGQQLRVLNQDAFVTGLSVSRNGNLIASCGTDDSVRLWDIATGKVRFKLPGHGREGGTGTMELSFSPDGKRFFSFGGDMNLRSYSVHNGRILSEHPIQSKGARTPDDLFEPSVQENPTFTPDARVLMLGDRERGTIRFIDVETGKQREIYRPEDGFIDYTPSPDGKLLATFQQTSLQIRDFGSKKIVRERELKVRYGNDGVFSLNGELIAFTVREQVAITPRCWLVVLGVETLEPLAKIEIAPNSVRGLAFSPDGTKLAASRDDSTVIVWDLTQFAKLTRRAIAATPQLASLPGSSFKTVAEVVKLQ